MIEKYFLLLWHLFLDSAPYLLAGLVIAGLLRVFIPPEWLGRHLGKHSLVSALKAALLGIPLPLCSCGVLPTAISLYRQKASLPATFAFLIATPQTSVDALLLAYALLGSVFLWAYPLSALWGALLGATALYLLVRSPQLDFTPALACALCHEEGPHRHPWGQKLGAAFRYAFDELFAEMAWPLLIGFLAAALVALLLPPNLAETLETHGWSYPAMLLLGLPLYVCATASIPLAYAFLLKGFSPGSVLIFLMAGPGTNITSLAVLSRIFGKKITMIYLVSLMAAALTAGMLLDHLVPEFTPRTSVLGPEREVYSLGSFLAALALIFLFGRYLVWKKIFKPRSSACGCGCKG